MNKKFAPSILAALVLFGGSQGATALSYVTGNPGCSESNVPGATACDGIYSGNNSNQDLDGLFGIADWTESFKVDDSSGTAGALTVTSAGDEKSGTWLFDFTGYSNVMFVLMGGNTFTAYLMDVAGAGSGTWNTNDLLAGRSGNAPGLSHFSVYTTPVPLPAAAWLFGSALLGMIGIGIRRSRKT